MSHLNKCSTFLKKYRGLQLIIYRMEQYRRERGIFKWYESHGPHPSPTALSYHCRGQNIL